MITYGTPEVTQENSNGKYVFLNEVNTLYSIQIVVPYANSSQNVEIDDDNGNTILNLQNITQGLNIKLENQPFAKILMSATTNYSIVFVVRKILYDSDSDLQTLIPNVSVDIGTTLVADVQVTSYGNPTRVTRNPSDLAVSLATANEPQQIATVSTIARKIFITNTSASDTVYVGAGNPNIPIGVNATAVIDMNGDIDQTDLSAWYFVGATAGDSIKVTYL
ncbi:MAG: hypothetical protein QXV17_12025 [Candidatus Micrarchaeaceae archaeon]